MDQPTPNIPLGFASTTEPTPPENSPGEAPEEPTDLDLAEAYCMAQEAEWEAKRVKSNIFLAALDRPIPESFVPGQTFPHPFWEEEEVNQIKSKFLTFLLDL